MIPAIWTAVYNPRPLPECLRLLHGIGWRTFEISTEHLVELETHPDRERAIAEAVQVMGELGVTAPQAHALLQANVAAVDEAARRQDVERLSVHLKIAARLGAKVAVIHPGDSRLRSTRADVARTRACNVEAFRRLGDEAGALGLRIGLENMSTKVAVTPPEMLDLVEAIHHPAIGITLDTSHANLAKLDIPAAIREWGRLLVATHISDNDGSGDQHRVPGSGAIDWPPIAAALREIGYKGLFNLEIPGERHPDPGLQELKLRHALAVAQWLVR